jgi:chromosome segregation ATPase
MSKVINNFIQKAKDRSKSRGKQRGGNDTIKDEHSDISPLGDSPRSVAGSSIEDLFDRNRSSMESAFAHDQIRLPISQDGNIGGSATNPFETSMRRRSGDEFDLTEAPTALDYIDVGHDSGFDNLYDFSNQGESGRPGSSDAGWPSRSKSVGRICQESDGAERKHRSKSTGRSERSDRLTEANLRSYEANNISGTDEIKRKSKMEKILQLQEKNQRYKDEFRKVQKDRKALKKEVENKRLETASLTKEIDKHVAEISALKVKLTECLRQLDHYDIEERKIKSEAIKLQKELGAIRGDYNAALGRVARMREEIEALKVSLGEKDALLESLNVERSEQLTLVESLQLEIADLKKSTGKDTEDDHGREVMLAENERLQAQLGNTLERASLMVKEREDAIADLLRENDEIKQMLAAKDENEEAQTHEALVQLRNELNAASAALEETQDRNVMLEEDVELWIAKGEQLEGEIQRLRDDVDAWQKKAAAAEQSMTVVEESAQEATKRAVSAETALSEAERKFKELLQEQERRHTEALFDQKEKLMLQIAAARESAAIPNPQDMMLQKAVADRKAKEAAAKSGSWGSVIQMYRGSTDSDEDLSPDQRRIKELEAANLERDEEINKVKSEMVRLRSTYNDTIYTNKKRIEQLESENVAYAAKQREMELELHELQKSLDSLVPSSGSSVASF